MQFAKPHLDVGLFTNKKDEQLDFWNNVIGLPFDHMLKLGGGLQQYRFAAHGSIIKVNDSRAPLPRKLPLPISKLVVASASATHPREYLDPDENLIAIVPLRYQDITAVGVHLPAKNISVTGNFLEHALKLQRETDTVFRCGYSLLFLEESDMVNPDSEFVVAGLRYLTLQVYQCDEAHMLALNAGAREGRPPASLGSTARVSFVISPDGLWIELSERASLTGHPIAR